MGDVPCAKLKDLNVHFRSVGVFGPPTSKFVFARLARMVCLEDTRFILVRAESPYVQFVVVARVTGTESL